jgi:hypothetical protein
MIGKVAECGRVRCRNAMTDARHVKPEKKKKNQMYNTKENLEIEPRV